MGKLTTHVLDTAQGLPGRDLAIDVYRIEDGQSRLLRQVRTNADGRCDGPVLEGREFSPGQYELVFHAGDYFRNAGLALPETPFLDEVVVRFGIDDAGQHYHVPLLVSPYGYTTYRGS